MSAAGPFRPVAIIGLACTYPGARSAPDFWQNIVNKVDAITDVTPDRWDPAIFYDPDPAVDDRIYCKKGGWIGGTYWFNPLKYGIMPSALEGTEADHFLVLRAAHEALADAGYVSKKIDGQRTGIILGKGNYTGPGVTALMYRSIVTEQVLAILKGLHPEFTETDMNRLKAAVRSTLPRLTPEGAAGLIPNICTGRVANRLDFMGRNLTVDAACASSLIAAELACHDLNEGRADLVLAGGVHVFAHIPFLHVFDTMRALSFSSTIRPFDEDCDGTMSGEGVGVLVLKRLADAERDGDRIYAVIRGVGSASDGRAKGIVAPRPEGEELAMRRAYEAGAISPQSVELVEAHGTATPAGDAAEAEALRRLFGPSLQGRPTCAVGSVKSMIGHAMPASGAASLIKTALALHHRVLPPTLNCRKPRAALVEGNSPFYLNTEARPWIRARGATPRRAGVSAFGFGGINAHIVLEEYTGSSSAEDVTFLRRWDTEFFVLEAESRDGLIAAARRLRGYAGRVSGIEPRDLAFTLNTSLKELPYRLAVVAESIEDLGRKLDQAVLRLGEPGLLRDRQGLYSFSGSEIHGGKVAVLFPGEGAQYANMLAELCIHFPEVRAAFDLADAGNTGPDRAPASALIFPPPPFSEDEAQAAENRLWSIDRATEAVLTADTAVFRLFERLGLRAGMMAGHSAGEWIALAAAGVLDSDEFFAGMDRLSKMYESLAANTDIPRMSMLAVAAGLDKVERLVREIGCEVCVANDNCFHQVVIVVAPAGESAALAHLRQNGIFVEKLPYDRGYHTPAFTYVCGPLLKFFSSMTVRAPGVPLYSCSTTHPYAGAREEILETVSNTFARPLLFRQTIQRMYDDGARIFVECGPRGNLTAFVDDILRGKPHLAVCADQFRRPGLTTLNHALAMLAAAHVPLDFSPLYARRGTRRLTLNPEADSVAGEENLPGSVEISLCYPRLGVPEALPARARSTEAVYPDAGDAEWQQFPPALLGQYTTPPDPPPYVNGSAGSNGAAGLGAPDIAPLLEEHVAVMEEFLRTHEAVMRGAFSPAPSPQPIAAAVALAPSIPDVTVLLGSSPLIRGSSIVEYTPEQSIELRAVLDLDEHLFLQDHCLYFEASDHGNQGTPLLSMPMTGSLELMAETAGLLCPGLRVVAVNRVQALRWINVKRGEPSVLSITAARTSDHTIRVTIQPESSGDPARKDPVAEAAIVFAADYPQSPPVQEFALRNPREPVFTAQTLYTEHLMFHGPRFQGIVVLDQVGEDGVVGSLQVLPDHNVLRSDRTPRFRIDPFLLDAAGQMVGYWPVEYLAEGYVCLPIRIANISLFRDNLPPGSRAACRVRIAELSHRQLRGNFDVIGPDGKLWMRVEGWEDWRFYWERHIHEFWRFPNRGQNGRAISIPALEGTDLVCLRIDPLSEIDKTGLWETLWMNMILNQRELEEHRSIADPVARAQWIFERAAAKDVARAWLKRNRGLEIYPADVDVHPDRHGRIGTSGPWTSAAGGAPHISVCYAGEVGIGAAAGRPVAIFAQPIAGEARDHVDLACAAAAAARLLGGAPALLLHRDAGAFTFASEAETVVVQTVGDHDLLIAVAHFKEPE